MACMPFPWNVPRPGVTRVPLKGSDQAGEIRDGPVPVMLKPSQKGQF